MSTASAPAPDQQEVPVFKEVAAETFSQVGQEPYFAEEKEGWKGYVEWERYPEKKKEAAAVLKNYQFPKVCEVKSILLQVVF